MDGSEELALVRADLGDVDSTVGRHQPRVLVDEPRLAQNVRRRVLKLQRQTPFIRVAQQSHHPLLTHSFISGLKSTSFANLSHHRLLSGLRTGYTDFRTGWKVASGHKSAAAFIHSFINTDSPDGWTDI